MYSVAVYFYDDKETVIKNVGSKRDMIEYIESFCLDYVADIQGNRVNSIKEIIKPKGEIITQREWDNNIRLWVNKSNNLNKYTVKQMSKKVGYLYNSYETKKKISIYLIQNRPYTYDYYEEEYTGFTCFEQYDEVVKVLLEPPVYEIKENYVKEKLE